MATDQQHTRPMRREPDPEPSRVRYYLTRAKLWTQFILANFLFLLVGGSLFFWGTGQLGMETGEYGGLFVAWLLLHAVAIKAYGHYIGLDKKQR